MRNPKLTAVSFTALLLVVLSCSRNQSDSASKGVDSTAIKHGETLFNQTCSACHNFHQNGIGPHLGGLTETIDTAWIRKFIRNPKAMIGSEDERSQLLFERFGTIMPSFDYFSENEISDLISYLKRQPTPRLTPIPGDGTELKNPIPDPIAMTNQVVDLKLVTTIPPSSQEGQLTRICKLTYRPDTKEVYVLDLRGKLYELRDSEPRLYMDMSKEKENFIDKPGLATGFGSFAFHPEFAKNGLLYTTHTEKPGSGKADFRYSDTIKVMLQWVLSEWKTDNPGAFPFAGKSRELFRANMVHSFHGVQEITFNPLAKPGDEDYGLLYIGTGDGSAVEFGYPFLAHSLDKIWGTIIRIDPAGMNPAGRNSKNGKYGIPRTNPFVKSNQPDVLQEIYAYGFRNPHRISWTRSGKILASNIGHGNLESLYLIEAGRDYGWPIREGSFLLKHLENMGLVYALPPDDADFHISYPVAEYDHDEGKAISGGFEYWGEAVPGLKGKYLFGDIVNGRLFYVEMADLKHGGKAKIREVHIALEGKPTTLVELSGAAKVDVRFGRDYQGELYVTTKPDGKIYKVVGIRNL